MIMLKSLIEIVYILHDLVVWSSGNAQVYRSKDIGFEPCRQDYYFVNDASVQEAKKLSKYHLIDLKDCNNSPTSNLNDIKTLVRKQIKK